ncbi:MAG: methionine synthase [Euryarchaeota archaeon]|nr:methionine synthase [Euryarchaeota archaeon]
MAWNCAPTCIGSLPHTDPAKAVSLILGIEDLIPFWPQLPGKGFKENMYAQYSPHLPGVNIDEANKRITVDLRSYNPEEFYTHLIAGDLDYFSYPIDSFSGLFEFLGRPLPKSVRRVKGQVTGPVSTGLQIFDSDGKPSLYDEGYCEIIRKNLNMMARRQERALRSKCDEVIMFIDEPSLSLLGTPFASVSWDNAVNWINEVGEGLEGPKAVHCCGNTDWPKLLSASIDILSFDAYYYAYAIALYPDELESFLKKGGALAWGIVPNSEDAMNEESVASLVELAERGFELLVEKGLDRDLVIRNSLLTPQCGLGGVSEAMSGRILGTLASVSKELRRRHGLEEEQ